MESEDPEVFSVAFRVESVLVLAVVFTSLGAGAVTPPGGIAEDRSHRDTGIHWPREFDPGSAPVFSHNELLIQADCHRVWTELTNAVAWPSWFVLTKDVTLDAPGAAMGKGTMLHLKIFGSPIMTRIDEFVPDSRLSWVPQGLDETKPSHYHTWRLVPEAAGCRVATEETGVGPNDVKAPESVGRQMHQAHELWLDSLRWKAEQ